MIINKKWAKRIIASFAFTSLIILANYASIISDEITGISIMSTCVMLIIYTSKQGMLFSPILTSFILEFTFGLYLTNIVTTQRNLTVEAMIVIELCIFLWRWITICKGSYHRNNISQGYTAPYISKMSFSLSITFIFVIAASAMIFEYYKAGGIPILRSDQETFRFAVVYNGKTHIFAVLNKIVAALIGIYFVNKGSISIKSDLILIIEMIISELLMIGTAMRGEMIMAPVVVFIFYCIKKKRSLRLYIIGGTVVVLVIGIVPILRMVIFYGPRYMQSLVRISRYPNLYFLTPLYQSLSANFDTLALDLSIFPKMLNYGYGIYSILPQIPFFDLGKSLMEVQNRTLDNSFYSGLTATYLASWYADFGYCGCIGITIIYALITDYSYKKWLKDNSLFSLVWFILTLYNSLWLFYNSTFDIVYIFDSIILWMVLSVQPKRKTK